MTNYERALAAAKTDKERNRLREVGLHYALGPDAIEWVQYALMGDLAGRCEAAAETAAAAAKAVQDEKAKPRASTFVVTPETAEQLADEIARAILVLRTDTARKVEASLHTSAENVMKNVAAAAVAVAPKHYGLRVLAIALIGVALCLCVGMAAGAYIVQAHVATHVHASTGRARNH